MGVTPEQTRSAENVTLLRAADILRARAKARGFGPFQAYKRRLLEAAVTCDTEGSN